MEIDAVDVYSFYVVYGARARINRVRGPRSDRRLGEARVHIKRNVRTRARPRTNAGIGRTVFLRRQNL